MTKNQHKLNAYNTANLECARIIVADPERYAGIMQQWAVLVLARAQERTEPAIGEAA